ncbi:MAG TPA: hypothetical protein VJ302_36150 [Blastocatellia bacterium]|nr:hypothetical protein [Blastocatellia bacterium]
MSSPIEIDQFGGNNAGILIAPLGPGEILDQLTLTDTTIAGYNKEPLLVARFPQPILQRRKLFFSSYELSISVTHNTLAGVLNLSD